MRVLLTGGNDVLQRSVVQAMDRSGHRVRLLLGSASEPAAVWPAQVEPWTAAADDPAALAEAAGGCDAAVLIDPSVTPALRHQRAPDVYSKPVIEAAARSGVGRIIRLSVFRSGMAGDGPPRPTEPARGFTGEWLSLRTAPVYGVATDPITLFLVMMRSLPAVPLLSDTHVLHPVWHADVAAALAAGLSLRSADVNRTLEIAGPDTVTHEQLYGRLAALIDRRPRRVPVPDFLAAHGARLARALGRSLPLEASHLAFARASGAAFASRRNALSATLGVSPTGLEEGLQRLVNELREVTPAEGVGSLQVKRFGADIRDCPYDASELLQLFRRHFKDVMPVDVGVEPGSPQVELDPGAVVTMNLPGRGHVQVRVEEVAPGHVLLGTLQGHAVAGCVRFSARRHDGAIRFEVMTCDSAANALDWLTLTLGGARLQDANWIRVVHNVVELSGGRTERVKVEEQKLSREEAHEVEGWIRGIIQRRRAAEDAAGSRQARNTP